MRSKFDEQLDLLNTELIEMGALCEGAISYASEALLTCNKDLVDKVISLDTEIDHKEGKIESICLKLLLQQQPVAKDLRQISSALKMITDMERIGDQAADIAEIITIADLSKSVSMSHIGDMAVATIKMVTDAINAFVERDLDLAQQVIAYDDVVDGLFDKVKYDLIKLIAHNTDSGEIAIDIVMIAKYFERIGDHATNIAEWVEYSITGDHKGGERI